MTASVRDIYLAFDEKIAYTTLMNHSGSSLQEEAAHATQRWSRVFYWPPVHRMT